MRAERIVIIGAGPAGCAAAVQCKRLGIQPLLLERTGTAGGLIENAFSIENYPGLEPTDGPTFASLIRAHLERFQVSVECGEVLSVVPTDKGFIICGDFGKIQTRSVIVSTGTVAKNLNIPGGLELAGSRLFYEVRELLPSVRLERTGHEVKKVLVIGGGEAALDYSLTMAKAGAEVTIFIRGEHLRAKGRLADLVDQNSAIEVETRAFPLSVRRIQEWIALDMTTPKGIVTEVAGAVIVAIGRESRALDLLKELDVGPLGALSTQLPGLFIAGDARTGSLGQAGMAIGDGLAAAIEATAFLRHRGFA
ncbi:MAG: NAD(P)/FAD-dependent oxidoreductase [Proteobacteria bacterium]|nr:NAD(P)/FAD-dependent oxidoreductase [Pseudomonadota bacterium]